MLRLLVVLLVACAADAAPPTGLPTWLDTWVVARDCLVASGNTREGISVARLEGRECSRPLHQLDVLVPAHPLGAVWRRAIDRSQLLVIAQPPRVSASIVDEVDELAHMLGTAIGHEIVPRKAGVALTSLPDPVALFDGRSPSPRDVRINAGSIEAMVSDLEQGESTHYVVTSFGNESRVETPLFAKLAVPSLDWHASARAIAAIDRGHHRSVVYPGGATWSYEIERSSDDGKHWTRETIRDAGRVVTSSIDRKTGELVLLLQRDRSRFSHRLIAGAPPVIHEVGLWGEVDPLSATCGTWMLDHELVRRLIPLDDMRELHGWGKGAAFDCRGDSALVLRHGPDVVEHCTKQCDVVFAPPVGIRGGAGLLRGERWIYASNIDGVVAVWAAGQRGPKFHRVASSDPVVAVAALADRAVLVLRSEAGRYSIVPLP